MNLISYVTMKADGFDELNKKIEELGKTLEKVQELTKTLEKAEKLINEINKSQLIFECTVTEPQRAETADIKAIANSVKEDISNELSAGLNNSEKAL